MKFRNQAQLFVAGTALLGTSLLGACGSSPAPLVTEPSSERARNAAIQRCALGEALPEDNCAELANPQ